MEGIKKYCGGKPKKRNVAVVVFYNKSRNILLQKRSGKVSKHGEDWGFFGGRIEKGENPEETLKREIKEELNYDLNDFEHIGTYENQYYNKKQGAQRLIHREIFVAPINNEILDSPVLEGDELKLFSINEAKGLNLIPGDIRVLEKAEDYLKTR